MFRQILSMRTALVLIGSLAMGASLAQAADVPGNNPGPQTGPAGAGPGNYQPSQMSNDFPNGPVHDWVVANAMAARARAVYRQAETDLIVAIRRAELRFENSEDYQKALSEERQAYNDYVAAREHVMAGLKDNSKYQAIVALREEMGHRISRHRAENAGNRDEVVAMATLKMEYASDARAIEVQALESSSDLKSARQRMVAASQHVTNMRHQLDSAIRDSGEIASARKAVSDARIDVATTENYACNAALASSAAVNYAWYLHRLDQGYYAPWSLGGVNGYYTPYWNR